jgi:Tfp pilus assembly protein PilF
MYARGHYLFLRAAHGGSSDELLRCREYFERALSIDAAFAPALAGLANFYAVAARRGVLSPFHETFARAIELSHQAIEGDPTLAVPHVHFAVQALYLDDDWEGAGHEFALAATLEPDYAEGRRFYGVWLGLVGRHPEALREIEIAAALEPDIPHMLSSLAAARLAMGDRSGAEDALYATLRLDPRHPPARERLLRLLEDARRYPEAVAERMRAPTMPRGEDFRNAFEESGAEGYVACLEAGLRDDAEELEARLSTQ